MLRMRVPFQLDWPVFAKVKLKLRGKDYVPGDHINWKHKKIPWETLNILYSQGDIYHNEELASKVLEEKAPTGDGLDELELSELHGVVDKINEAVSDVIKSKDEFERKKCKKSTVRDKQIGHIRRWRSLYGKKLGISL